VVLALSRGGSLAQWPTAIAIASAAAIASVAVGRRLPGLRALRRTPLLSVCVTDRRCVGGMIAAASSCASLLLLLLLLLLPGGCLSAVRPRSGRLLVSTRLLLRQSRLLGTPRLLRLALLLLHQGGSAAARHHTYTSMMCI
jgi:hypothetical protein